MEFKDLLQTEPIKNMFIGWQRAYDDYNGFLKSKAFSEMSEDEQLIWKLEKKEILDYISKLESGDFSNLNYKYLKPLEYHDDFIKRLKSSNYSDSNLINFHECCIKELKKGLL